MTNFAEESGLTAYDESSIFFVSSILRKFHQADTSAQRRSLGYPAREDVDFFVEKLRRLDVEFVFVQAKTSAAFGSVCGSVAGQGRSDQPMLLLAGGRR
jgi:hypothetical protein